jgi:hypothetical protein
MKKSILRLAVLGLLSTAIAFAPAQALAQEKKNDDAAAEKKDAPKEGKKKREGLPARGKVTAIDKAAKTFKVGERVFHINAETRITKAGKPAKLEDAAVGEDVGIYYKKDGEKLVALTVRFGPRPEGQPKGEKKGKKKDTE